MPYTCNIVREHFEIIIRFVYYYDVVFHIFYVFLTNVAVLGISLRDRFKNTEQKRILSTQSSYASRKCNKQAIYTINIGVEGCLSGKSKKGMGRQLMRSTDGLVKIAGKNWMRRHRTRRNCMHWKSPTILKTRRTNTSYGRILWPRYK